MEDQDKVFGSGFIWLLTSVFLVILPTGFSYLFRCISEEKFVDISEYYGSILLIVFSVSCSLIAICLDIRSKTVNKILKKLVLILSSGAAVFFGLFYFYLFGMNNFSKNNYILYISATLIILFGIFGFYIANKHNKYDGYINDAHKNIISESSNKQKSKNRKK